MKVESLKELSALIDMLRRKGVSELSMADYFIKLGDKPERVTSKSTRKLSYANIEATTDGEDQYSAQDLLMWSASPQADDGIEE